MHVRISLNAQLLLLSPPLRYRFMEILLGPMDEYITSLLRTYILAAPYLCFPSYNKLDVHRLRVSDWSDKAPLQTVFRLEEYEFMPEEYVPSVSPRCAWNHEPG